MSMFCLSMSGKPAKNTGIVLCGGMWRPKQEDTANLQDFIDFSQYAGWLRLPPAKNKPQTRKSEDF